MSLLKSRYLPRMSLGLAVTFVAYAGLTASSAAADQKHPDFTGVWGSYRSGEGGRRDPIWPKDPPFTPLAQKKIAAYHALVDPLGETPGGYCVGMGVPGNILFSGGYPMEIIQKPDQITIIYEAWTELRRIYIDKKIDKGDLVPTRNGFSEGHWEGNTLVVETTSLEEQVDAERETNHSDKAKLIERYTLGTDAKGQKVLTAEVTLDDPTFYTKPVTVTKKWAASDERMLSYDCTEPTWQDHLDKLKETKAAKNDAK